MREIALYDGEGDAFDQTGTITLQGIRTSEGVKSTIAHSVFWSEDGDTLVALVQGEQLFHP